MKKFWEKLKAFVSDKTNQLLYLIGFALAALIYVLIVATKKWWVATLIGACVSALVIVSIAFGHKQNDKEKKWRVSDFIAGGLGILLLVLASLVNLG